ncbi:sarcosine oxidase, delta subunit family [compost metagenome]
MFFRDNPRGLHHELWVHATGCRKYFNVTRHTVTYEILETYKIGEKPSVTADSVKKSAAQPAVEKA